MFERRESVDFKPIIIAGDEAERVEFASDKYERTRHYHCKFNRLTTRRFTARLFRAVLESFRDVSYLCASAHRMRLYLRFTPYPLFFNVLSWIPTRAFSLSAQQVDAPMHTSALEESTCFKLHCI